MPERRFVSSGSPHEPTIGFSRATRIGTLVAVSGTAPVWPDNHVDPDPLVQARRCWEIALNALAQLGGTPSEVIRTRTVLEHDIGRRRSDEEPQPDHRQRQVDQPHRQPDRDTPRSLLQADPPELDTGW